LEVSDAAVQSVADDDIRIDLADRADRLPTEDDARRSRRMQARALSRLQAGVEVETFAQALPSLQHGLDASGDDGQSFPLVRQRIGLRRRTPEDMADLEERHLGL